MDNLENYLLVDKFKNKRGEDTTEFRECEGKLIIKQYAGINTDNFVIKKIDGKKLSFAFFKINGIYYVNLNGEHIIDYKKFISIQQISKLDEDDDAIKIKNNYIGDMIIHNCDPEMFQKSLQIMSKHMKGKKNYFSDFVYFMFH